MRALVQRVSRGSVYIRETDLKREIGKGMVILLGVRETDNLEDVKFVADKCCNLRIFEDAGGKMNISVRDIDGELLVISQFTLYGDARKGNRPNFTEAAPPESAEELYDRFIERLKMNLGDGKVKSGEFGAMMDVEIINDGPVTVLIESK